MKVVKLTALYIAWMMFMFVMGMGMLMYTKANALVPAAMMISGVFGASLSALEADRVMRHGKRRS